MYDGVGLVAVLLRHRGHDSSILKHMCRTAAARGPSAALPVAGQDGTLDTRMQRTVLDARVEAKTARSRTVASLSGYLERKSGERWCSR